MVFVLLSGGQAGALQPFAPRAREKRWNLKGDQNRRHELRYLMFCRALACGLVDPSCYAWVAAWTELFLDEPSRYLTWDGSVRLLGPVDHVIVFEPS